MRSISSWRTSEDEILPAPDFANTIASIGGSISRKIAFTRLLKRLRATAFGIARFEATTRIALFFALRPFIDICSPRNKPPYFMTALKNSLVVSFIELDRESFSSLLAAAFDDITSCCRLKTGQKAVRSLSFSFFGVICL